MIRHDRGISAATVALTTRCDLQCAYCYQGGRPGRDARWSDLRPALDWLAGQAGRHLSVAFTGGEPLVAIPLLRRALAHLRRRTPAATSLELQVATNGQRLTADLFGELTGLGVQVRLSADGIPAAQDARGAGTFAIIDRLLDDLARAHPRAFAERLTVVTTLTPAGVPHLADGFAYFLAKGVRDHAVGPVTTPCPGWDDPDRAALDIQFARIADLCRADLARTGEVPFALLRRFEPAPPGAADPPACSAAAGRYAAIDVDGRVAPCALFAPRTVRRRDLADPTLPDRLCWGRPDAPDFADRRQNHHAVVAAAPAFGARPRREDPGSPCCACPARDTCRICPFVAAQQARRRGRHDQPGFLCAVTAVAADHRRRMPALRMPPEQLLRPEMMRSMMRRWEAGERPRR